MADEILQPTDIGSTGGAERPSAASEPPKAVTPWDARQAARIGRDSVRALTSLHEAFARTLAHALSAHLRAPFEAALVSMEYFTYRDYLHGLPEITYLGSCKLAPTDASALLQMDLSIAFPLIDLLLGGEGKGALEPREVTEIEEQILESVLQIICRQLGEAWQPLGLEFHFAGRQQTTNALRLMAPDDKVLALSFTINLQETRGTLQIAIPAIVSTALLRKVSADRTYRKPEGPTESKEQVKVRLLRCPAPVELRVLGIRVAAEKLMNLKPGDLLTLQNAVSCPATLMVDDQPIFQAAVMRHECRRVARLIGPCSKATSLRKDVR